MSLSHRWIDDRLLIAKARRRCYRTADRARERYEKRALMERGCSYLLVERDGEVAGTSTHHDLKMWVHGSPMPCQGIAYVGASKTERRRGGASGPSVASVVMREMEAFAREREYVCSALVPFRSSFYEYFGYGTIETRVRWSIPTRLLPEGRHTHSFVGPAHRVGMRQARQTMVERGHCDIERTDGFWNRFEDHESDCFSVVDIDADGNVAGSMMIEEQVRDGADALLIDDWTAVDDAAFRRHLVYLSSLRDQYAYVTLDAPLDWPLNLLLAESGVANASINNDLVARTRHSERLQLRILDHARFLAAVKLGRHVSGQVSVCVQGPKDNETRLLLSIEHGEIAVSEGPADCAVGCTPRIWSALVTGALPARLAHRMGLLACTEPAAVGLLHAFADSPAPFCQERF